MTTPKAPDLDAIFRALTDDRSVYFDGDDQVFIHKYGDDESIGTLEEIAERIEELLADAWDASRENALECRFDGDYFPEDDKPNPYREAQA